MTIRISLTLMLGAVLFGYLLRLGLIFVAVFAVRDAGWISLPALGATIIVTHLGLLVWELKYLALSLAYPGLKPLEVDPPMLALEFPPINEVIRWQDLFPTFNKIALIACLASLIGITIYLIAARRDPMVAPTGVRNVAETGVEFIEDQIVMQTIGRDGLRWTPFLLTIFIFVYLCNLPGIIPIIYMPATARMAIPLFLAVDRVARPTTSSASSTTASATSPACCGRATCRSAMRPLVGLIEFLSNIILRPFSLAVRLFANMLAGHMLLVTFALLTNAMLFAETKQLLLKPMAVLPFFMLLFLTAFEVLVGFLQAYIFTILTAVYIGLAAHPEH